MSIYFLDSSALVKRYAKETGTAWVQSITDPVRQHTLLVAQITGAEIVAANTIRRPFPPWMPPL